MKYGSADQLATVVKLLQSGIITSADAIELLNIDYIECVLRDSGSTLYELYMEEKNANKP